MTISMWFYPREGGDFVVLENVKAFMFVLEVLLLRCSWQMQGLRWISRARVYGILE